MKEPSQPRVSRGAAATAGVVSAAVALGVGEAITGLPGPGPSLVTAVGTEFIDRFAASLKDLAVELFGTNDKPALVVGIVITSLLLGAVSGTVAARRFLVGITGFVAFGIVGLWAYLRDPLGSTGTGIAAAVTAVAAGIGSLAVLLRLAGRRVVDGFDADPVDADPVDNGVADGPRIVAAPASPMEIGRPRRREFLVGAAVLGVGAASTAMLGRRLRSSSTSEAARRSVTIPRVSSSRSVPSESFAVPGLSPYITPNTDFYRIDTALVTPQVDVGAWRLDVTGLVDRPFSLTYDELLALEAVEETVTLQCVSNEVGGNLVDNAVWQGVPLAVLLDRAGVRDEATQVVGRSVDRWTAGFPTDVAGDGRVALVAYAMNGEPLPTRHGFPARLVVAGLYGYVSATKWLREIELTTWDAFDGYWISRGWAKDGPIKTMSRIDVPGGGDRLAAGRTAIAGVAWAPSRGVSAVEVRVDDGEWQQCRLGDVASENTWVQWLYEWDATPGDHAISVRATDTQGDVQTGDVTSPAPDGATGWHTRRVRVSG
ncbi:MAG TPA: molybdopterin-dependent oxidoreductase [Ilumatobacteraceae bacterium]|nr:molybdopterin-dependent oxidoreductase [Ilumatobacteraceae bacterium]